MSAADSHSAGVPAEIRRLGTDDVHAVWEILHSSPEAADWSENIVRNSVFDQQMTALVAAEEEEVCGAIFGLHIVGEAEILNLAVKHSHRRKGIGGTLIQRLLSHWEGLRIGRIFLEVRKSNAAAIELYEGMGFRRAGLRKGYYSSPEEDALVLERTSM